jgi:histidyl-tRNA synthetase
MLQRPRGTRDFLPDEMQKRRIVEGRMRDRARIWGYGEVCTPTFEHLELFTMRSGEGIVQELYAFEDKGARSLALRPEITAAVLRMYVNEAKVLPKPLRWYYFADCFRYERPQKGRYRQFWQFGTELIGADTALADAEVILLADDLLRCAGVTFDLQIGHLAPMKHLLGTVDPAEQRKVMACLDKRDFEGAKVCLAEMGRDALVDQLIALAGSRDLAEVFEIVGDIPERSRIEQMFQILDASKTPYSLNFGIARGLDYYTGMVFEGFAENLGAESQVMGGGAYRLAHLFGGEDVPSCGFAIGFDRVMVSIGEFPVSKETVVAVVSVASGRNMAFAVARAFRDAGITTEVELMDKGVGAQIAHASKTADFVVILGERECATGRVTVKDLHSGEQRDLSLQEAIAEVKAGGPR